MRIRYLALLWVLFSCSSQHQNTIQRQDYRHYEGEMDGQKVYLDITFSDTLVNATWYTDKEEGIQEMNGIYHAGDSLNFEMYIPDYTDAGQDQTRYIKGQIIDNRYEALYINGDSQKRLLVKEIKPGMELSMIHAQDTLFRPQTKQKLATSIFTSVYAKQQDGQWLNTMIYRLLGDSTHQGDMPSFITKTQAATLILENEEDIDFMQEHPYEYDQQVSVYYYRSNRLIVCHSAYQYTGGAHGMHALQMMNIDTKTKKTIGLSDVLSPTEINRLPVLLEKKLRQKFNLTDTDSLNSVIFDEHPELVNTNYYITHTGIGFIYNPYEIAAYSYGTLQLFVPFSELKKE